MRREAGLNAKGYSERDEKRILDALGRGLLKDFPNPERAGCPSADVLKTIASHEMPLAEAEKWLGHLTSCSPCYIDFTLFRTAHQQQRRTQTLLAIAAGILIVASLAGWAFLRRHGESFVAQTAVLDLRNRSVPRGTESNPAEPPLEVRRTAPRWKIYLPLGSSEGQYEVRVLTHSGESITTASEKAIMNGNTTSLEIKVNLRMAHAGHYVLQIGRANYGWNSYPLDLRE